jgi:hypothetical protein
MLLGALYTVLFLPIVYQFERAPALLRNRIDPAGSNNHDFGCQAVPQQLGHVAVGCLPVDAELVRQL